MAEDMKLGEKRIKQKFLILPMSIEGKTRWLTTAMFEEEVIQVTLGTKAKTWFSWKPIRWVDESQN
jgi:hypothetical protein